MLAHLASAKLINLPNQSVEEVTVVRHDNHCSVKIGYCLLQHILCLHIQMVGRLVKDKEVDRLKQQTNHCQSSFFSTRKHFHLLVRRLASKHKRTEDIPYFRADVANRHLINRVKHRYFAIKQRRLILSEIADFYIMPDFQISIIRNFVHYALHKR